MKRYVLGSLFVLLCSCSSHSKFEVEPLLDYCGGQIEKSLNSLDDTTQMPRNILSDKDERKWNCTSIYDWTSGFWPGILWYAYEYSHDAEIKKQAERYSSALYPVLDHKPATMIWDL